jgi:hypothetical protein
VSEPGYESVAKTSRAGLFQRLVSTGDPPAAVVVGATPAEATSPEDLEAMRDSLLAVCGIDPTEDEVLCWSTRNEGGREILLVEALHGSSWLRGSVSASEIDARLVALAEIPTVRIDGHRRDDAETDFRRYGVLRLEISKSHIEQLRLADLPPGGARFVATLIARWARIH